MGSVDHHQAPLKQGKDAMNGAAPVLAPTHSHGMPKYVAQFCRHGKPLRGLMGTIRPKDDPPPVFQGRFGHMFPDLKDSPATYGATKDESRFALMSLGFEMTSPLDPPKDGFDGEESSIPALYTYFGQFIDHDITFDPVTTLMQSKDADALTDFRTPALDLDNVYGRGPNDQPYMYDSNGTKFLLGEKLANGAPDLPRNHADPARAIIGDPRNDENTIISQFQALMLRFHNRAIDDHPGDPNKVFPLVQRIVRWHYQWVVVHDFLERIVSSTVLDTLKTSGRYDRSKIKFYDLECEPYMPVEFSAAAYRLGHSMIRPGYRLNSDDDTLLPIFPVPETVKDKARGGQDAPQGGIFPGLGGFHAMAKNRGIDWGRFIDIGNPRAYGEDPGDDVDPTKTTEAMKRRLQLAYRIDTSVVTPLAHLPPSVAPDNPQSLAQRNLLRGFELGLPTGQAVAKAMRDVGVTVLHDDEILIGKAVDKTEDPKLENQPQPITTFKDLAAFQNNCPLWTYILAEAIHHGTFIKTPYIKGVPNGKIFTPQLGPVGGRIVAETFLGMLFGDPESFLNCPEPWTPTIGTAGKDFKLKDIVGYALFTPEI